MGELGGRISFHRGRTRVSRDMWLADCRAEKSPWHVARRYRQPSDQSFMKLGGATFTQAFKEEAILAWMFAVKPISHGEVVSQLTAQARQPDSKRFSRRWPASSQTLEFSARIMAIKQALD